MGIASVSTRGMFATKTTTAAPERTKLDARMSHARAANSNALMADVYHRGNLPARFCLPKHNLVPAYNFR